MVSVLEKERNSFSISINQYVTGATQSEQLAIRAFMEKGPKWPDPSKRLPSINSLIAFTGRLFQCEDNPKPADGEWKIGFAIALDSITYLPRASFPVTSKNGTAATPTNADNVALTGRVAKFACDESDLETPTPAAGPSPKQRGKRKAAGPSDADTNSATTGAIAKRLRGAQEATGSDE